MVVAVALPGSVAPGVVHPVEHGPDARGGVRIDELDLGHVAVVHGELVRVRRGEVGDEGIASHQGRDL